MRISRNDMVGALDAVKGAVATKTFQPILTHVLVDGQFVTAFDSEIGIKVKLAADCGGKFNVKFDAFYNLLRALDADDLEIDVEKERVRLTCGKHKSSFQMIADEFPMPRVTPEAWRAVPAGFKEALERCLVAASDNEAEKLFSSVFVKTGTMYATDRATAVRCTMPELVVDTPILLSRKSCSEIMRLGQPERVAVVGPWSLWDYGNLKLLARLREGVNEYPPLDRMMDGLKLKADVEVPEGILGVLSRVAMFAPDKTCRLKPSPLGLELSATGPSGDVVEWLPMVEGTGAKAFDPSRLSVAIPYAERMSWGPTNGVIYLAGDASGFEFMLSPMVGA